MGNDSWKRVASILMVMLLFAVGAQAYVLWRLKMVEEAKDSIEQELNELKAQCHVYEE